MYLKGHKSDALATVFSPEKLNPRMFQFNCHLFSDEKRRKTC